jgi:hypothetical protein
MLKTSLKKFVGLFGYEFSQVSEKGAKLELEDFPCINVLDLVVSSYVHSQPDVFGSMSPFHRQ